MLIFQDVDREKEVLVDLTSIVAIEESNHGKNCFLYLNGGHKFHVTATVTAVREAMKAAKDEPTRDFEVSKEA